MRLETYTSADLRADAERQARRDQQRETRLAVLRRIDERLRAEELDLTADLIDPHGLTNDLGLFTRQRGENEAKTRQKGR